MQAELLHQAALALDKCGKPIMPPGVKVVDIPDGLVYVSTLSASVVSTVTGYVPISGDTTFMVRAISIVPDVDQDCFIQVQWPDGTFLFNDISLLSMGAACGSFRRSFSKEIPCPPGSQITVTLSDSSLGTSAAIRSVALIVEGVWRYMVQGDSVLPATSQMAEQKRYFRSPNGNILAPEWELDTHFAEIPSGVRRGPYTMVSLNGQFTVTGGPTPILLQTIKVPVSSAYEFQVRRLTFEQVFDDTITGDLLVRPRDGSGYALYSDYAPVAQVNNAPYAKDWCIRAGVNMFFDFLLRNITGTGNVVFSVNVIGSRQKRQS